MMMSRMIQLLEDKVKALKAEQVKFLKEKIRALEEQHKVLKEEISSLKAVDKLVFNVGQLAFYFEEAICSYVWPEFFPIDDSSHHNIRELLSILNRDVISDLKDEKPRVDAKRRWHELRAKLAWPIEWNDKDNWTRTERLPDDLYIISQLKRLRVNVASHPDEVNLDDIIQILNVNPAFFSPYVNSKVQKFVNTLKKKMELCNLQHPKLIM